MGAWRELGGVFAQQRLRLLNAAVLLEFRLCLVLSFDDAEVASAEVLISFGAETFADRA